MSSFSVKKGDIEKIQKQINDITHVVEHSLEHKMKLIVDVVYKTASARRPKVSGKSGKYRVSDPNATLGVPVNTGALQASITKDVRWEGKKVVGEIDAGANLEYAKMIEFGTSRMKARPFMRPAWNENIEWIKKKFKERIEKL